MLKSRLAWLGAAVGILVVALAIRAVVPLNSPVEQISGTALYASMIYAGTLVLAPALHPYAAGAVALAWCWGAELFQLTGIPAALSAESLLARLALGTSFDPLDLVWYPLGVIPLAVAHRLLRNN